MKYLAIQCYALDALTPEQPGPTGLVLHVTVFKLHHYDVIIIVNASKQGNAINASVQVMLCASKHDKESNASKHGKPGNASKHGKEGNASKHGKEGNASKHGKGVNASKHGEEGNCSISQ